MFFRQTAFEKKHKNLYVINICCFHELEYKKIVIIIIMEEFYRSAVFSKIFFYFLLLLFSCH